jgi:acyl-coenzyme A synthetase/AMP-(fatty) acid ligase
VCTWYEVNSLEENRITPIPIGKPCANTEVFAIDDSGKKVEGPGIEGELCVRGPTVMKGYWGDPERSAKVLVRNPFNQCFNETLYMSGDIVTLDDDGNYYYAGRRDGMIKTRGYRVELGEIESVILSHAAVKEAAVTPIPDELISNRLRAFISLREGNIITKEEMLSFCTEKLPKYMIPESFEFLKTLPKTSTGKTDRVRLTRRAVGRE